MALELTSITFNHDPLSSSTSALNVRRNKDFEVLVPEYVAASPPPQAESSAAYSIADTAGQPVTIEVQLTLPAAATVSYEIKATGGGVAGPIDSTTVAFSATASVVAQLPLAHRHFDAVARDDITWEWKYREIGNSAWLPLATTLHRIYLVLSIPNAPWTQAFGNKRNPWTDLLDECCVIASGSTDAHSAARNVTQSVNSDFHLRYDIQSGAPTYDYSTTGTSFDLTNWIEYVLRGNAPATPKFCQGSGEEYRDYLIVNCYDCGASVSLMSKVLGVTIEYQFHQPFGYLKYVEPIGRGKCNNPFYGCTGNNPVVGPDDMRTGFGNHAYPKLAGGRNYDACMREWLHPLARLILLLIWLIVLIITLGTVNLQSLRDRAGGWLINVTQPDYDQRTIDVSQPFEANAAGGAPAQQVLEFQVV